MDLYSLGCTLAECLSPGTGRVWQVVNRLTSTDPAARGTRTEALLDLADAAGDLRPWPQWLDRFYSGGGSA
ncbi:hypothetical protein E0H75_00385 [Kribbella capetownensis]|uniref:Protein kinase domain-containing protein n=1 Tax=Kribbella capetownensis TaxID=1572659 RepID=A0A4R0JZY2_9ACTN|nr:hypothetical protein E0H75_00385 [Kribbella capetownensis]